MASENAPRDQNFVPAALFEIDGAAGQVMPGQIDQVTGRILVDTAGGGSGTVTSVSVVTANGFAGTVATPTTTPAITLSTTITGLLKGNGTAISAATAGTDYTNLAFKTISVSGQSNIVAGNAEDTLTLAAGSNITITTNPATNTATIAASGGGTPAGSNTQVQFNNSGAFGADADFTYTNSGGTAPTLTLGSTASDTGTLQLHHPAVTVPGYVNLTAQTFDGTITVKLPVSTTTLVGTDTTDTLSNKSINNTNSITAKDSSFGLENASDITKTMVFDLSGISTATLRTLTVPNASGTIALTSDIPSGITVGTTTITSGTTTRILYDNAGVLGEYTITGSGTTVAMATAPTFVTSITTPAVLATANDSGALGASGTAFSDLFLASGGVVNWNAGDYTLTHSAGILTANKDLRITTAGTNTASVVTVGASQTLTNKTLTAPAITTVAETGIGTADLLAPNNHAVTVTSNAGTCSQSFLVNTFTNSSAATMAITLGISTPTPKDGQFMVVRIYDFSAAAQTIGWTNTENSTVSVPTTSNGSTTHPLSVCFQYNAATSLWRCVASA